MSHPSHITYTLDILKEYILWIDIFFKKWYSFNRLNKVKASWIDLAQFRNLPIKKPYCSFLTYSCCLCYFWSGVMFYTVGGNWSRLQPLHTMGRQSINLKRMTLHTVQPYCFLKADHKLVNPGPSTKIYWMQTKEAGETNIIFVVPLIRIVKKSVG